MKLIVFDMDGVIFEDFNFWLELHKAYGTYEEGIELTKKYLKTDYQKLVDEVIGRLWKGKDAKIYFDLVNSVKYVHGAKETLKELKKRDYKIGIVSSGPSDLAERAKKECGVDYHFSNKLLIEDGKIAGSKYIGYWPIRDGSKRDPLKEICRMSGIDLKDTIVVVHDENDIEMAEEASFAIGFFPTHEKVIKQVDGNFPTLNELIKQCDVVIDKGEVDLRRVLEFI